MPVIIFTMFHYLILPHILSQVDYESYDWHCLDLEAESTKKRVEEFFIHDEKTMTFDPIDAAKWGKYAGHKLYSESIMK